MDTVILSATERADLMSAHPVVTKDYLIVTPVIQHAYSMIRDRVWSRSTGTFMHATPRMGKTTCVKTVKILLEKEFPKVFILSFSAVSRGQDATTLFREMLYSESMHVTKSASLRQLTLQLQTHIESNVMTKGGKQFVLMIDEMQRLNEEDFRLLHAIHNRLDMRGMRMTTLGFAQPNILHLRSALHLTQAKELIARFLCEPIPFDGCGGREDLEAILEAYDKELFFPEDSTVSFTEFFVPSAFEHGFRLAKYALPIWKQLQMAAEPLGTGSVPMEHLTRTVECLLLSLNHIDEPQLKLTAKSIDNAVVYSNLKNFSEQLGN